MGTATPISFRSVKRPPVRLVRAGAIAFNVNVRVLAMAAIGLVAVMALGAWGLTLGSFELALGEVVGALAGSGSGSADFIVLDLRLPRVLAAVLVGPMLAMSGAIFQGLVRNPLVSPDIIGINAGASVAAVYWIVSGQPLSLLPVVAFAGALTAAAILYALSWRGRISGPRLVLVGIGIDALLDAGVMLLIVRSNIFDAARAYHWLAGSVYSVNWGDIRVLAVAVAVLAPLGMVSMWYLRVMQTGDLVARSVGIPLETIRLALILIACGLNAVAVSLTGPIGFVALIVPHAARMLGGPMSGGVFLFAGILGGMLVLGSDMVGQHALPVTMPVGVLTAAVGAPYFLFLLYRTNTRL
jgi:iron complex transport system permease protein